MAFVVGNTEVVWNKISVCQESRNTVDADKIVAKSVCGSKATTVCTLNCNCVREILRSHQISLGSFGLSAPKDSGGFADSDCAVAYAFLVFSPVSAYENCSGSDRSVKPRRPLYKTLH